MGRWWPAALLGCAVAVVAVLAAAVVECAVTYDKKAVLIDGQRRILFSGSIHYPRSTPDVISCILQNLSFFFSPLLPRGGGEFMAVVSCVLDAMLSKANCFPTLAVPLYSTVSLLDGG
jgi:hypothetical protein